MLISEFTKDQIPVSSLSPCSEKILLARCDRCMRNLEIQAGNYHRSQIKRNHNGLTYCRPCSALLNAHERRGKFNSPRKGKFIAPEARQRNPWISTDGYRMIFDPICYQEDTDSGKLAYRGYRKEHILVMERYLNRKLQEDEEIHHIDHNKLNNQLENLIITTSVEHKAIHSQLRELMIEGINSGKIHFDAKSKKYQWS